MNKKETLFPIIVFLLSGVFIIVSAAVFFSRGKSKFWLSKKMKIGALLLSFSAITIQQQSCVTCYEPVATNDILIETDTVNFNIDNKIKGTIHDREGTDFSFKLTDSLRTITFQEGNILPADGMFDENTEDFIIEVDTTLETGKYAITLSVENRNYIQNLTIINEN